MNQKKIVISVSLSPDIIKILNEKTSNKSNYLDFILLKYFSKKGEDVSKVKL